VASSWLASGQLADSGKGMGKELELSSLVHKNSVPSGSKGELSHT